MMLALMAAVPLARAQQQQDIRPLLDRMDRLERDINLLQRQVYRGGTGSAPVPASPPGDASSALNFEMRVGRIEDQMRTMTGQIEETSYKIEQLRQNLEKLQSDLEVRFNQLEGGSNPANPPSVGAPQATNATQFAPPPPPQRTSSVNAPLQLRPPPPATNSADGQPLGKQPGTLGMIRVPEGQEVDGAATSNPVFGPSPAQAATPPQVAAAGAPVGAASPQEQYNAAFSLLRQARYEDAEAALRGFVQQHPRDTLAPAAQYWLGETFYVRKDYGNAASTFADGYEKYAKSSKGPDFLLKLGMSLANAGQKDNACRAYQRLERDYPQASSEIRDRSGAEKKRLGCGA
ncbi:MAG: tol-pal system protein YbgF [Stellaceae bacterium]